MKLERGSGTELCIRCRDEAMWPAYWLQREHQITNCVSHKGRIVRVLSQHCASIVRQSEVGRYPVPDLYVSAGTRLINVILRSAPDQWVWLSEQWLKPRPDYQYNTCIHKYIHTCMYSYIHIMYICTYVCTYIRTYVCTYIHMYIHYNIHTYIITYIHTL